MASLIYSKEARDDLVSIRDYIRDEKMNPTAASRVIKMIRTKTAALKNSPEMGVPLDAIVSIHTPYRFLVCEHYIVFYLFDGQSVEVIRILHQLQDFISALFLK